MKTLKQNYKINLNILAENLKRGMSESQALTVIDGWESSFRSNHLYGEEEQEFVRQARQIVADQLGDKTRIEINVM